MAESVKFTEEEMKQINNIRQGYVNLQNSMGQLSVSRIRLEQQLNDLNQAENDVRSQFTENQSTERDFVDTISKKYGDGNLDVNTGVFIPKPVEETTDKTL